MNDDFDKRLDEAARALGERQPELDARLDDAVMAAVRQRGATPARRKAGLRWFIEKRSVQIRPIWAAAGLAAAAALAIVISRPTPHAPLPGVATRATPDTVYVHFALTSPTAHNVSLAGSFNGWDAASLTLRKDANGVWEATVPLAVGEHKYQFVVDGQRWVPDPSAAQVEDGFGGTNSVIVVSPKGVVRS